MAETEANAAPPAPAPGRLRNAFGGVLCALTLLLIGVLAFSIRLFSVRSDPHPVPPDPESGRRIMLPELCVVYEIRRFGVAGDQVRERDPRVRPLLQLPRHSGSIAWFHLFRFCSRACGIGLSTHRGAAMLRGDL